MRIAIASSGLGHVTRGIEAWAADLARSLADRDCAVTLYKGAGQSESPNERVIPCWQRSADATERLLHWLPARIFWRLGLASGYGIEQTTFALGLLRHLRREPADILHVQDPQLALIMQRAWRAGMIATRTILAHGTEEPLGFLRKITFLQHLAPWHMEEARAAGVWKPTWTTIPNFIDTDLFRPGSALDLRTELNIPPGDLVVLTTAAIKRDHKRIDYLIQEFAQLRKHAPGLPVRLVIAGGWEQDTPGLIEMGKRLLGDRVHFLVRFGRARMTELYRLADLFVLCSVKEMMPIALLEAMASGLPALVHRHPVLEWMTGAGGRAIDMRIDGTLAQALASLLADQEGRQQQGAKSRSHCIQNFGRDQIVDQMIAYYWRVLGTEAPFVVQTAAASCLQEWNPRTRTFPRAPERTL